MNIRKIIREQVNKVFEDDSLFGDTLDSIQTQLQGDLKNVDNIIQTQNVDMKNMDNQIKANLLLKGKLDAQSPHKKGLEREIPETQKDYIKRQKQLKDLEVAKKGMEDAQTQINKQKIDLQNQTTQQNKPGAEKETSSVLPSLKSPI
jgi:hypothetical protein